ncbi:MAG: hypothetical protein IJT98_00590 [Prevotella sp.]|nr:hypothetical protein [Prevotella sp.]
MKKIFTLCTLLFAAAMSLQAQVEMDNDTFVFTDLDGNPLPNGAVITISTLNAEGQMVVPVKARNTKGQRAAVSMYEMIDDKPGGEWQTCAFGNCMTLSATGYSPKNIVAGDYDENIATEWIPEAGQYASWTATLQIHVFNITQTSRFGQVIESAGNNIIGYGPSLTLNFVYADPSAISLPGTAAVSQQCYTLSGLHTDKPQRGLNIVRLSNGAAIKKIVR